jgi:hypothetical protein
MYALEGEGAVMEIEVIVASDEPQNERLSIEGEREYSDVEGKVVPRCF